MSQVQNESSLMSVCLNQSKGSFSVGAKKINSLSPAYVRFFCFCSVATVSFNLITETHFKSEICSGQAVTWPARSRRTRRGWGEGRGHGQGGGSDQLFRRLTSCWPRVWWGCDRSILIFAKKKFFSQCLSVELDVETPKVYPWQIFFAKMPDSVNFAMTH